MKKLMIAAVAVAFAAVAQAATINWGGDICQADCDTPLNSGATAYLIFSSEALSAPAKVTIEDGAWTIDNGATLVSTYSITGGDIGNYTFKAEYKKAGEDIAGYFGVIVVDGGAAVAGATGSYTDLGYIEAGATDPAKDLLYGDGSFTNWIGENGFADVTFESVPEPTSGLLLLLGMAGLALKRKQA